MNRNKKKGKEGGQIKRTKNRKKVNQRVTTIENAKLNRKLSCKNSRKNKEVSV